MSKVDFPILEQLGLQSLFSAFGRKIFLPQGIFYWSRRAKEEGDINATIGTAVGPKGEIYATEEKENCTLHLPLAQELFSTFSSEEIFSYAPIVGVPKFRQAWRDWIIYKGEQVDLSVKGKISLPIVTSGITNAIAVTTRLFCDPGEPLVCAAKRWGNYDTIITRNAGVPILSYNLLKDGQSDIESLTETLNQVWKKRDKAVLILNFPNNPTGFVPTKEETEALINGLVEAVNKSGKTLIVLCDDAYEGFIYDDDAAPRSIFYSLVNLHPAIIPVKMDGASKEFLFYGGRIGAITFGLSDKWLAEVSEANISKEIENKIGGIIRGTISNCNHLAQEALYRILEQKDLALKQRQKTIAILSKRANIFRQELANNAHPSLTADPFRGGFFAFINVVGLSATAVAEHLLKVYRTGVVPAEKPGEGMNGIRVAFCGVPEDKIPTLVKNIALTVKDLLEGNA